MKLAREIAEDFFKDWDDEHDGVAIGLSAGVLAHIIAAKLEPRLDWSEPANPNDHCTYTHTIAETPFGRFLLTWKGWKESPDYGFDETPWNAIEYRGWGSVEEAQAWAGKEMKRRIDALLSEEE